MTVRIESRLPDTATAKHDRSGIANAPAEEIVWISPAAGSMRDAIREGFEYRELLGTFVWRDLTTRYRNTVLGVGWALMQPIGMMMVLSLFVGKFMHAPTQGLPYPVFAFAGLLCFQYFSTAVTRASVSLMGAGGNLVKKLYFPRALLPLASVTVPLVDLFVGSGMLLIMLVIFHVTATLRILCLPLFMAMAYGAAIAVSFWLSALYVRYRDIHHLIPFALQAVMFASPVAYASNIVPQSLKPLYELNMLVAILDGFRWCLMSGGALSMRSVVLSLCMIGIVGITGALYFRSVEGSFADKI